MFLRRKSDVCVPNETKLKRKGEVMYVEVVDNVSGLRGGRKDRVRCE